MTIRSVHHTGYGLSALVAAAKAVVVAWQRRRVIGRLGALDDHLLADIGVTRQDVLSVLAEPLFIDPSEKLADRARDTRRARRASMLDAIDEDRSSLGRAEPRRAA